MKVGGNDQPSAAIAARLARCRAEMRKHRLSSFLVTHRTDYFYLSGFSGEDSAVLVRPRDVHVISDRRFEEVVKKDCPWARAWMRRMSLNEEIASVSRKLRLRSLAVQPERFTLADQTQLKKLHRGLRLVHAPAMIGGMRRIKGPTELAAMTKAIRVAEESFLVLRATIRPGDTELQLAARLEYEMKCRGASDASFATICAIDDHAALPHARPGARKVKRGSAILFDWGATVGWYHSDLTRMVFVDTLSRRLGEVYRIVLEAQARAIAAIRPGARMCDVDAVARDFIKASGYGERFGHGLGHGLGLEVHEPPSLSWRSDEPLAAGMVVTVEPGIYLPGVGGVRIEDDVVVTETGCRVMTSLSKKMDDCRLTIRGVAKRDSQSTIDNLKC